MNGVRVGKLGVFVLLVLLVGLVSGCAWRTEFPSSDEEAPPLDCVEKADFEALKAKIDDLESRVETNKDAAADAMMTADKALKCCRQEFVTVFSEEVNFAFNSAELSAETTAKLDKVADKLKEDPDYIIEIAGHADAIGNDDYNIVLGQKRADAARAYLVDTHHIAFTRIAIRSGGEAEPVASNDTDDGRAKNRRATISVLGYSTE